MPKNYIRKFTFYTNADTLFIVFINFEDGFFCCVFFLKPLYLPDLSRWILFNCFYPRIFYVIIFLGAGLCMNGV